MQKKIEKKNQVLASELLGMICAVWWLIVRKDTANAKVSGTSAAMYEVGLGVVASRLTDLAPSEQRARSLFMTSVLDLVPKNFFAPMSAEKRCHGRDFGKGRTGPHSLHMARVAIEFAASPMPRRTRRKFDLEGSRQGVCQQESLRAVAAICI